MLERSRSGNGGHVWVFFDGPVAAAGARAIGAALLRQAMSRRAELDLASYDRFFPSQDFLPKAGFGNLIALPLQGACVQRGTTVFLDPTTMEPWPGALAIVERLDRDGYQYAHSMRAELLRRLGRGSEALDAYQRALKLAEAEPERRFLRRRIDELGSQ